MTDIETYLSHCYHVLLTEPEGNGGDADPITREERCACANLIEYQEKTA